MKKTNENYLEKIPALSNSISWESDENGIVTINKKNKGIFNRIMQLVLRKPKVSYIHLDEFGSFILPLIDGERDIISLGESVREKFGERVEPLYERLAKYFRILESYGFIEFKVIK